jgi:hypothetical protein
VSDQILQPYKATVNIVVLYTPHKNCPLSHFFFPQPAHARLEQ